MKRVFSTFNLAAAHHAKNLLDVEGIRSVVRNEILSSAMGELPPAECQVEVWVLRENDAARAEKILDRREEEGDAWNCTCGERIDPQFTQCWRCGAYRR